MEMQELEITEGARQWTHPPDAAPLFRNLRINPREGHPGDSISICFEASDLREAPTASVNSNAAELVSQAGDDYCFRYRITAEDQLGGATLFARAMGNDGGQTMLHFLDAFTILPPRVETVPLEAWPAAMAIALLGLGLLLRARSIP